MKIIDDEKVLNMLPDNPKFSTEQLQGVIDYSCGCQIR